MPLLGVPVRGAAALAATRRPAGRRRLGALALGARRPQPPSRPARHRSLWRLRPRSLAGLRRVPREGSALDPLGPIAIGADLCGPTYPRGRLIGPVRVLLRYPVEVRIHGVPRGTPTAQQRAAARRWRLTQTPEPALHRGKTLEVPAGREVVFE